MGLTIGGGDDRDVPDGPETRDAIRTPDALAATGLLVLGGAAAFGAFASTAENAPLFLLFAAAHLVAAVGVAFRRGWARIVGLVLTGIWLMGQILVLVLLGALLLSEGNLGVVQPVSIVIAAGIIAIAGGTFGLLWRQRIR